MSPHVGSFMTSRRPVASPFSNHASPLSLVIGRGATPRIVAVNPWMIALGGGALAVLLAWYLAATVYLIFRDEMLGRLMSQQAETQYAYEDRLAALRNQLDKVTSRQLLDQNTLEGKLHELLSRQAQLETRQAVVATLIDQPIFAGQPRQATRPTAPAPTTGSVTSFAPVESKPAPALDSFELRLPESREPRAIGGPETRMDQSRATEAPAALAINAAREAADRMEQLQVAALDALANRARSRAQKLSAAFAETGLDPQRFVAATRQAQGGPLLPIAKPQNPFELRLNMVQTTIQQADRMQRIVAGLPIARPMPAEFETTSSFGARSDPFTRGWAMHTGIDFRAPTGTAVRVTAAGRVVEADYVGGYGNMVEVDHGNGLSTRYAHLSSIGVEIGQTLAKGDIVGRVGSTGRSTGPHLHYETRIDGEATDPLRFIRAGQRFAGQ